MRILIAATLALTPLTAVAAELCKAKSQDIADALSGQWIMNQADGEVSVGEMRLPLMGPMPVGQGTDVTIEGHHRFTFHHNAYDMNAIDSQGNLFEGRDDMAKWLDAAIAKVPQVQSLTCDEDWPVFKVYGTAHSGFNSEVDIRLIAFSASCMIGVQSMINEQFNGDPMPSGVNGVVLTKGANGCG